MCKLFEQQLPNFWILYTELINKHNYCTISELYVLVGRCGAMLMGPPKYFQKKISKYFYLKSILHKNGLHFSVDRLSSSQRNATTGTVSGGGWK